MIKEKHLVPGRVLLRALDHPTEKDKDGDPIPVWVPVMVIAVTRDVTKRRHSKKALPAESWNVLVLWFGEHPWCPYEQVRIWPHQTCWKPAIW